MITLNDPLDLEEGLYKTCQSGRNAQRGIIGHLEVVDLPRDDREQHNSLQYRPPLHSGIGRFCRISVCPFTNHDIFLLVLH